MNNSAQIMKQGDVSLGLVYHFIGAFGRAGGTKALLQRAADSKLHMRQVVDLLESAFMQNPVNDFFVTRGGLKITKEFESNITPAYAGPLPRRGLEGVGCFDLVQDSSDETIMSRAEMGGEDNVRKYAFTPDQLANMYDERRLDSVEPYLDDNHANIFYVIGLDDILYVVTLDWDVDDAGWRFDAFFLSQEKEWEEHSRVFYNTRSFEK